MEKDEKKEEMVDENKENGESSCEDGNQIWRCSCGNYNLPEDLYCSACGSKKKPSIEQSVESIEESPVKKQEDHLCAPDFDTAF